MEKFISMNKKAQGWGIDLIIAFVIFFVGILLIYNYAINNMGGSESVLNSLESQAETGSSLILSEGSPENWTKINNTKTPGILSENKINQTKLNRFYNITNTEEEYTKTKLKLGINEQFYFNFSGMKANGEPVEGIGKKPSNPRDLFKLERVTVYENKITKFNMYIWD